MTYKVSEIKKMSFDCFHRTGEYMDHWKMDLRELDRLLVDFEEIEGKKWKPIYLPSDYADASLCAIVETLFLHDYITCFTGEMSRKMFGGELIGESSLLKYVLNSNFRERQEKARLRKYKRK